MKKRTRRKNKTNKQMNKKVIRISRWKICLIR